MAYAIFSYRLSDLLLWNDVLLIKRKTIIRGFNLTLAIRVHCEEKRQLIYKVEGQNMDFHFAALGLAEGGYIQIYSDVGRIYTWKSLRLLQ